MNLKSTLFLLLIFFYGKSIAQNTSEASYRVFSGVTFNNQLWRYAISETDYVRNYKPSFLIGVARESNSNRWIKFTYGGSYFSQGFSETLEVMTTKNEEEVLKVSNRFDYFLVSLGLKTQYVMEKMRVYSTLNLFGNMLVFTKTDAIYENETSRFNRFHLQGALTIGIDFNRSKQPLFIELGPYSSITPSSKQDGLEVYNFGFFLKTGIVFQ